MEWDGGTPRTGRPELEAKKKGIKSDQPIIDR